MNDAESPVLTNSLVNVGQDVRRPVFQLRGFANNKRHSSLPICAVWSAPLLNAYRKISYLTGHKGTFNVITNMFLKGYPLEAKTALKNWNQSMHIFSARPASFCHLGVISIPLIVSKFHNETYNPKGQDNKIYTIMKGRETLYRRHTAPVTTCSEFKYVLKVTIDWFESDFGRITQRQVFSWWSCWISCSYLNWYIGIMWAKAWENLSSWVCK